MSRWRRFASNAVAASSFGLLAMLLGSSAGCEFIARVDRAQIPDGEGGAGGAGGAGGGCSAPADCPGTDTVCRQRTCTATVCGFVDAPAGTPTDSQNTGDCLREICDGMGTVTTEPDDLDTLEDNNDCTTDLCNAGMPENVALSPGAACASNGGKVCDGMSACVECVMPSDCTSLVCASNQCVPAACIDTVKNGSETDVDCGGADCAPCVDGLACVVSDDCANKVCTFNVCQAATCTDAIENGTETDVDCGGTCAPCGPSQGCNQDTDCVGGSCSGSVCLETCSDSILNNNETDIDCGGPACSPCADGETCSVGTDCTSKICDNGACAIPTCADTVQNGLETAVDCGGPTCSSCVDGQGCSASSDCSSGVCTGMVCQAPTCMDVVKNGSETDVDCGGGVCSGCDLGKVCGQNPDCMSNICVSSVCVISLCGDGLITGAETCDDGNANGGDGCDASCAPETGFTCAGAPTVCTPICNDSLVVLGEGCDDGNGAAGDGCAANCTVESGYACMGSPSTCAPVCGDGIISTGEDCDDGNVFGGDGCGTACGAEVGFNCAGMPSACTAICGDSLIVGFEECDDGDAIGGDGCSSTCSVEQNYGCAGVPSVCYPIELEPNATCVDASGPFLPPFVLSGRITPAGDQDYIEVTVPAHADLKIETFAPALGQCSADTVIDFVAANCTTILDNDDDSGTNACSLLNSTVDAALRNVAPGTYYVKIIDFGSNNAIDAYKLQVSFNALCGDGLVQGTETCDDGNLVAGDGCAVNCRVEPVFEAEPNDVCGQANGPATLPVLFGGAITPINDKDLYSFTIPAHADVKIQTYAPNFDICTATDTAIELRGTDCTTVLTTNNDGGVGTCSLINSTTNPAAANLPPGTYYVRVEENGNNATIGAYQLLISLNSLCGDGLTQGTETCDDGNTNSGDGCTNNCRLEQGWTCTGAPNVCTFNCGNGAVTGTEKCDDGNTMAGDGCSNLCVIEPGYVCTGAPSTCVFTCGNGLIDGADQCDDGNTNAGDGCSPGCAVELNYRCAGAPSVCTIFENLCNDSVDNDGDGAADAVDTDCQIPAYFPACSAGQLLRVFKSTDVPKPIPDSNATGATSNLFVGIGAGTIARAALVYTIPHTWVSDLDLSLITPTNTTLDVCSDNGGAGDNFTNTVLDSTCALPIAVTTGAPFSGCYYPETSFASLVGTPAQGTWKFKGADDAGGDVGTITAWAMVFCIAP